MTAPTLTLHRALAALLLALTPRIAHAENPPAPAPPEQGATVRTLRPAREVRRETLTREEIRTMPGTGGDALRAVQNLPGVARASTLSGDLVVRGSSPADTQVYVDGTPLPLLYHFLGLTSTIATEMLERIDFYPANFSSRFGRSTGGVVDVALRDPPRDRVHATANQGLLDAGLFAGGPLGHNLSFAIGARYGWIGPVLDLTSALFPSLGKLDVSYGDYQALLEYRPDSRTRVRLAVMGASDRLHARAPLGMPSLSLDAALDYHLAQLSVVHAFAPDTEVRASASLGWNALDGNPTGHAVRVESTTVDVRYELTHALNRFVRLHWGADVHLGPVSAAVTYTLGGVRFPGQPAEQKHFHGFAYQPGLYIEAEATPVPTVRIVSGLRFDYSRSNAHANLSPRMNAQWAFAPGMVARAGVGVYTQAPRFDANGTLPLEVFSDAYGGYRLDSEQAVHYALAVDWNVPEWFGLSVEGFYKSMEHLITVTTADALQVAAGQQPAVLHNDGVGRAYGLEVLARPRFSRRVRGFIAYTLMRAERRDGPTSAWYPFDYDQTHTLTVLTTVDLGAGWTAGVRFRYVTGHPYTPVGHSVYLADEGIYYAIPGPHNAARAPDFHQLDVRVEKRWQFSHASVSLYLEVLNAYNQANVEQVYPNADQRGVSYVYGLPIIPNLGLRGEI